MFRVFKISPAPSNVGIPPKKNHIKPHKLYVVKFTMIKGLQIYHQQKAELVKLESDYLE